MLKTGLYEQIIDQELGEALEASKSEYASYRQKWHDHYHRKRLELRREDIKMKRRRGIIDRFEGDLAVVEFGEVMEDIPKSRLPDTVQPGDVLWFYEDGKVEVDAKERKRLSSDIDELMDELWED